MNHSIFSETSRDGRARTGRLELPRGEVVTPVFMPVGTAGTVKAIELSTLHQTGFRLILGNTYHLYLRPGTETLAAFGGLHRFAGWNHNILTDSGGFQVFSLAHMRTVTDEGVRFQSHLDGSTHSLTPESVVDIQTVIGSDIQMALDVCTGPDISREEAQNAMDITHHWAARAVQRWRQHGDYQGHLFPIVQGNFFPDLRRQSVETLLEHQLPGLAIGGLSVGEPFSLFVDTLAATMEHVPRGVPRYVMGIGTPEYILAAIEHGVDMFDCVFPTRAGRNGTLLTRKGRINIRNARWKREESPPDPDLDSFGGTSYSLGYLHHLFKAREMLGPILATRHNLMFLAWLVEEARRAIGNGTFEAFKRAVLEGFRPNGDER